MKLVIVAKAAWGVGGISLMGWLVFQENDRRSNRTGARLIQDGTRMDENDWRVGSSRP